MRRRMPAFTPRLEKISRDYYHIRFLDDGYPGKVLGDTVVPHPIYGIYVLTDYLFQFKKTGHQDLQDALITVADAVLKRMNTFQSTLVFWYAADSPFNSSNVTYYSGLTQGYYAKVFAQVYEVTRLGRFRNAAKKVFQSLQIPVHKEGVLHHSSKGPSLQEYPMAPNGYVLNGWLSIILAIREYAKIVEDAEADQLWRENAQTVSKMLHLYDVPAYQNSRYTLNGHLLVRLSAPTPNVRIDNVHLHVPNEGEFAFKTKERSNRWENYIAAQSIESFSGKPFLKKQEAILNVLFSRSSYPVENVLYFDLYSPEEANLHIDLAYREYDPKKISLINRHWNRLSECRLSKGKNKIKVNVPWSLLDLVGHPTTFKKIGQGFYNVYHFIHIDRLKTLSRLTGNKVFSHYAQKWQEYVQKWPHEAIYEGMETKPYQ